MSVRLIERPLSEEEVREPLSLADLLAATFGPPVPVYAPGRVQGVIPPRPVR